MTRCFIATPDRNHREHDFSGAFRPESERLLATFVESTPPNVLTQVDISAERPARRAQLLAALREGGGVYPFHLVALLCHGWKEGIQLGFLREHVQELAAGIASVTVRGAGVVLYACSAASSEFEDTAGTTCGPQERGTRGFADLLWESLACCTLQDGAPGSTLHLDAHDRAGHTTSNPYVRRFDAEGEAWLVAPDSPLWPGWHRELHDRQTSRLRLRYGAMSRDEIALYLRCHYDISTR